MPGYWPDAHLGVQLQNASLGHSALGQLPADLSKAGKQLIHWIGHRL